MYLGVREMRLPVPRCGQPFACRNTWQPARQGTGQAGLRGLLHVTHPTNAASEVKATLSTTFGASLVQRSSSKQNRAKFPASTSQQQFIPIHSTELGGESC